MIPPGFITLTETGGGTTHLAIAHISRIYTVGNQTKIHLIGESSADDVDVDETADGILTTLNLPTRAVR